MSEEIFKPRPGGLVDSIRRDIKHAEEIAHDAAETVTDIPQTVVQDQGYRAVRVQPETPDVFGARTVNIGVGATAICLPHDINRARATISVVTSGGSIVLSQSQGNASNGTGYTLTDTASPLVLTARGILYAYNPGSATVTVAILSELYTD